MSFFHVIPGLTRNLLFGPAKVLLSDFGTFFKISTKLFKIGTKFLILSFIQIQTSFMLIQDTYIHNLLAEGIPFIVKEVSGITRGSCPFKMDGGAVCICTGGEAEISIDTVKHQLLPGCEMILLDGSSLFIKRCSGDFRMTIFIYSKEVAFQAMHKFDPSFFANIIDKPIYHHRHGGEAVVLCYMEILKNLQHDTQNRFSSVMAMNLLRCIMLNKYDKMKRQGNSGEHIFKSRKEDIYHQFMYLINEHSREHRDVAYYAEKLCISTRYLAEVTKETANESPKQSIDYYIISEIKLMLTFSEMSIQQIADYLHFPDQSYLGRFFKHHTGLSPLAFRMQELGR